MHVEEFRKLIVPLSEKEKMYRRNPEKSLRFYEMPIIRDTMRNGVYTFTTKKLSSLSDTKHADILPGIFPKEKLANLILIKQQRFSIVPMHTLDCIEMTYVYRGESTVEVNGQSIHLKQGDVCIVDQNAAHRYLPAHENDIILNIQIAPDYFNQHMTRMLENSGIIAKFIADAISTDNDHDQFLIFHTRNVPTFHQLIELLYCEYLDPGICGAEMIDNYMCMIFINLARSFQISKMEEFHSHSHRYITEILQYIEDHSDTCTLEEVAEQFGYNTFYTSRMIKNATGYTYKQLVDRSRLAKAIFLLRNTEIPVSQICADCGWTNENQFYKKFKELYGTTPGEYREKDPG